MNRKYLIAGLVVLAVVVLAFVLVPKKNAARAPVKKAQGAVVVKTEKAKSGAPVKKVLPKDKGGLTIKIVNVENKDYSVRIKAFRADDAKSGSYAASFASNKMEEVLPGSYDIEIDTIPQKIYKNINVSGGAETVEDLGCVTGALDIKALNSKNRPAYYAMRVISPRTGVMLTSGVTNRTLEVLPGIYNIDVGTTPAHLMKDVKIERNKKLEVDLGCVSGALYVKAADENKKDMRLPFRVKKADTGAFVTSGLSNSRIEIAKGVYVVELLFNPPQIRKDVKVLIGEEAGVEFTVQAPPAPAKASAPSKK